MEMIERLLRESGESVAYATGEDGRRVHSGNAYRCPVPEVSEGATVYAVECIDALPEGWVRIDHHRPGDPRYGQPPDEFLAASSIGQVIDALARLGRLPAAWRSTEWPRRLYGRPRVGVHAVRWSVGSIPQYVACVAGSGTREVYVGQILSDDERSTRDVYTRVPVVSRICAIPEEYLLIAAADHCPPAAYRGECPGVDPDVLMRWRAESRAKYQGRTVDEVLADVERARAVLRTAPMLTLAPGLEVRDLRGQHIPALPEAAAREGAACRATVIESDGRAKIVLGGHTTPAMVQAFLDSWGPAQGLTDIYGVPARGYAGGYLP